MLKKEFDFYNNTNLKSYNLSESMRYQLNILDSLDVFTRKHSENVASLTCRICEYLHLNRAFTEYCTICAYLHDIGKQFIPQSILQKPGKLTDEEYEIMKTHTTIGYKMCLDDSELRPYAAGPLYHHEALNGTGYPQGLVKKDIPYEGQIIRVADEYDAIVSKRQYKSHVGITDTLKILIENTKVLKPGDRLYPLVKDHRYGRTNGDILKKLFKVVIDDIEYEISSTLDYVETLKGELKRMDQIDKYKQKMEAAKSEKKKKYYLEGMKVLLIGSETVEEFPKIYEEYKEAYKNRKNIINNLYDEIAKVKKLRV